MSQNVERSEFLIGFCLITLGVVVTVLPVLIFERPELSAEQTELCEPLKPLLLETEQTPKLRHDITCPNWYIPKEIGF